MKKAIIILMPLLFISIYSIAQETNQSDSNDGIVDEKPTFKGGSTAMYRYLRSILNIPKTLEKIGWTVGFLLLL